MKSSFAFTSELLLGPQVSFDEARCPYIQLKMRSFKQHGNGWRFWKTQGEICTEDWLKPLSPPQSVLPHPDHSHTHTHREAYALTRTQIKAKENEIIHYTLLLSPATCYFHCFTQDGRCYHCTTQNTQGDSWRWGHLLVLAGSGDLRGGLEGGEPGSDRAAEDDVFCHRVNLLGRAKNMCLWRFKYHLVLWWEMRVPLLLAPWKSLASKSQPF